MKKYAWCHSGKGHWNDWTRARRTPKGVMLFFEKGKSFAVCILYTPFGIAPPPPQPPYSARAIEAHGDEIATWPYHLLYYRNVMLGWEELPNKDFPIIFHPVYGKDEREGTSPSFFNVAEVETIERYLRKLLDENVRSRGLKHLRPEMIGIISPYKRQVRASVKYQWSQTWTSH